MTPYATLPALFESADAASMEGQRWTLLGTKVKAALLLLAALCGVASLPLPGSERVDLLGLAAVGFFVGTLFLDILMWRDHPERRWYDGRALAESTKTLSWKFAVCGEPFSHDLNNREASRKLVDLLSELQSRYRVDLHPVTSDFIPQWMIDLRLENLEERKRVYRKQRLDDQLNWYNTNSVKNRSKSRFWRGVMLGLEGLGFVFSLVAATTNMRLGLSAVFATGVAVAAVWLGTRQYDFNARAYSTAAIDLSAAKQKLLVAIMENDWAREMNDAEDAISREHTVWLASRSG